ncbi:MAG TPA: hypothetical protein VGF79_13510 [Bacteroidia bacterium]
MKFNFSNTLLKGWSFSRWLRLILGLSIAIQTIYQPDFIMGTLALTLLLQAVFNVGCCAGGNCSVSNKTQSEQTLENTTFEEIK